MRLHRDLILFQIHFPRREVQVANSKDNRLILSLGSLGRKGIHIDLAVGVAVHTELPACRTDLLRSWVVIVLHERLLPLNLHRASGERGARFEDQALAFLHLFGADPFEVLNEERKTFE